MDCLDVTDWTELDVFAQYPVGARSKALVISPDVAPYGIKASWPYLFKRSIKKYPDQFWCEIVAYRIGLQLGFDVPKAVPSVKTNDLGHTFCGALIEWFHHKDYEKFAPAGDYFVRRDPNFDREKGTQHSLEGLRIIAKALKVDYVEWLEDMALFDAVIGNTDRHQENWGFVFSPLASECQLAPFFDNGTSLCYERFPKHVADWTNHRLREHVGRGLHHLRKTLGKDEYKRLGHLEFIKELCEKKEALKQRVAEKLAHLNHDFWESTFAELTEINCPVPLTRERAAWIVRVTNMRIELIKGVTS